MAVLQRILSPSPRDPLLLLERNGETSRFPITQDIVSIGRSAANGIRLDDTNISKRHCLLVKTPDGVKIVDLESTNGTFINEKPVKEGVLRDGDQLRVGPFQFRFAAGRFVPPPASVMPGETAVGHPFADLLVRELRRTPFWLISLIIHMAALLLLWNADFAVIPQQDKMRRVTANSAPTTREDLEDNEEEKVEEEVRDTELTLDPDDDADNKPDSSLGETGLADESDGLIGLRGGGRGGLGLHRGLGDIGLSERDLGGKFGEHVADMRGSGLDVAMVFDSTGSMQGIIDQVKSQINLMNTYIGALVGDTYRLAMVTYRDKNDEYVVRVEPFTHDYYKILIFVEGVHAAGGGDIPEAVHEGLRVATRKLRWRKGAKRVILLFGDAPPHDGDLQKCRTAASWFKRHGGVIHTIFTEEGAREDALDAADRKTVNAYRTIARYGGGTFNFLDQESQIVRSIQTLIFGKRFAKDVARLSDRIDFGYKGRLIERKMREHDLDWLLKQARNRKKVVHPLVVDALIKLRNPRIIRAMRQVIQDPLVPEQNRSAARYILLRKGFKGR